MWGCISTLLQPPPPTPLLRLTASPLPCPQIGAVRAGGGTSFRAVLGAMESHAAGCAPGARHLLLFFTDGALPLWPSAAVRCRGWALQRAPGPSCRGSAMLSPCLAKQAHAAALPCSRPARPHACACTCTCRLPAPAPRPRRGRQRRRGRRAGGPQVRHGIPRHRLAAAHPGVWAPPRRRLPLLPHPGRLGAGHLSLRGACRGGGPAGRPGPGAGGERAAAPGAGGGGGGACRGLPGERLLAAG